MSTTEINKIKIFKKDTVMFLRESRKDAVQQLKRSHGGEARQDAIDIGCGLANLHHLGYYMRAELAHNLGHHFCRL